ncbi:MAG: polysaccharide deacetylase family protein [Burkholderiaceae bacterium]
MNSRLVFSLDFELMWGVRDHRSVSDYGDAVLGVRKALPELLRLFDRYGVKATWATVGLLFARNRKEMLGHFPDVRPEYWNAALSPLNAIRRQIGEDEAADPHHYGRSLVDQVLQSGRHEVATHTYTHYYCLEPGQSIKAFEADLTSAIAISSDAGVRPRSIVFPRNQMTSDHAAAAGRLGIPVFRGNPTSFMYHARPEEDNNPLVRGLRLMDACMPVTGRMSYRKPFSVAGCLDLRASRFFRPYSPRLAKINDWHVRRIVQEMEVAAKAGEIYHLWCHPHNFGRHTARQLTRLETILQTFQRLQETHGMQSVTMSESATIVAQTAPSA